MKALSIRQPWIGAILSGAKTVEVRAWPTRHRGPLYLHASKTYGRGEREQLGRLRDLGHELSEPDPARFGSVIGRARLVDCRLMETSDWPAALVQPRSGRLWAWVLADARPLRRPIRVRGQRLLFNVDGDEARGASAPTSSPAPRGEGREGGGVLPLAVLRR